MTYALVPNFSVPLAPIHADRDRVPFHADPILAAIEGHEEAYAVFQGASQGGPTLRAFEAMEAALEVMLGTPCATRFGAFALLRHLRWWIEAEAFDAEDCQPGYSFAKAREADLTLLLGCDGVQRIPVSLPSGRLVPAPVQHFPPQPLTIDAEPVRAPALVRLGRAFSSAGEHLTGFFLIGGGCLLIGIMKPSTGLCESVRRGCPASKAYSRPVIEEAVQGALDAADKLIALLDTFDGDPEAEDAGDAEPSLGAPEGHESQVAWLRGTTRDFEQDRQTVDLVAQRGRDTPFSLRRPSHLT